jgi:hypothetical protein
MHSAFADALSKAALPSLIPHLRLRVPVRKRHSAYNVNF